MHKRVPFAGAPVSVALLAKRIEARIAEVSEDGRLLLVLTEEGELMRFELSRATGNFMRDGQQFGARLLFEERAE